MRGKWTLTTRDTVDDRDWDLIAKRGALWHVFLENGGRRFPTSLYDPYRTVQDASYPPPFYEPNFILVPEVTRAAAHGAVEWLARDKHIDWLLDLAVDPPQSTWSLDVAAATDRTDIDTLDAWLVYGELRFPVTFYDLEGIAVAVGWNDVDQFDAAREKPRPVTFYAHNLIVLPEVTEEAAAQMVDDLARRGEFDWLLKGAST
ncbi:hypothetical protein [Kutzneria sp. NPDC051319]|uniref:hypothetical protein n=1 Tax=Kutzneria sp. NPDC051319 TaxID=3155047 RepID=UPI0034360E96